MDSDGMDSDETLYARTRQGDLGAFDALYARYQTRLYAFLLGLLGRRADAEDAFHETFMRALQSREVTFKEASFRTWLYRIGRNLALNQLRSQDRGERALAELGQPAVLQATAPEPVDVVLEQRELGQALEGAVARLPPALAEVYHLRASGLSYDEMAAVLEVPLGTLKSRMHDLVGRLRKEMVPWIAP